MGPSMRVTHKRCLLLYVCAGEVQGKWCPSLPEAVATGFGLTPKKPLPTFPCRVSESGEIEVDA